MVDLGDYYIPAGDLPEELRPPEPVPIDGALILRGTRMFFAPTGPLKQAAAFGGRPYEYRAQQGIMAEKTAEALAENHNLCVEAPTGVGKSFAYLVPALLYAHQAPQPVIVSTETINLQEQLIEKDLPLLRKLSGLEFKAALAKGRGNYLCLRRLSMLTGDQRDHFLPLPSLTLEIDRLKRWSETTEDGNRDSLQHRVDNLAWSYVCCEGGNCRGQRCGHYRRCFYWRARLEWEAADIIVANHALFLTDLKIRRQSDASLLPAYSAVVIDEAHTLENNAAEHLGLAISQNGLTGFFNRLFNPDNAKGLLLRGGEEALELRREITEIREKINLFFGVIARSLEETGETILRLREPNLFPDNLTPALGKFRQQLADYIELQEDKDYKAELSSKVAWCDEFIDGITQFLQMGLPDHVYWIERQRDSINLLAAPLNVAAMLEEQLFRQAFPVILSSATLTVGNRFDYFRSRVGFCEGAELQLDSPFSSEQVRLCIPRQMPEPTQPAYQQALFREIPRFIERTHGKAFVLFTSYQLLRQCADQLKSFFFDQGLQLLIQGEQLSRSAMLKEFKNDIDSVIFGTDSFWTGVDVPGEALSNVIVTKLPFAVPSHPLIAARSERLEAAGKSSFMDYSLPEAVLKFRQGVGRLIRSRADRGIIVILDRRIVSKRYGKIFLDSIPPYPVEYC